MTARGSGTLHGGGGGRHLLHHPKGVARGSGTVHQHHKKAAKPKKPVKPKKPARPKKPVHAISFRRGDTWPLVWNDRLETCGLAALGSSFLMSVGTWPDEDALSSYGTALSLMETFETAMDIGICGVTLKKALSVSWSEAEDLPGVVIGMTLDDGDYHAAMSLGEGLMTSWGGIVPLEGTVEEAWILNWR